MNVQTGAAGLCGRILRGRYDADFEMLSNDPARKMVFLLGADGLEKLAGLSGYKMLTACGYSDDDVAYFLGQGLLFKLVVFRSGGKAVPATWKNIALLAGEIYPDIRGTLLRQTEQLAAASYDGLQRAAGFDFADVARKGAEDPRFMTYERYQASGRSVAETRAFYEHTLHMRRLFSGDGFAYDEHGNRGVQEYCALNAPLQQLSECTISDLAVELPIKETP